MSKTFKYVKDFDFSSAGKTVGYCKGGVMKKAEGGAVSNKGGVTRGLERAAAMSGRTMPTAGSGMIKDTSSLGIKGNKNPGVGSRPVAPRQPTLPAYKKGGEVEIPENNMRAPNKGGAMRGLERAAAMSGRTMPTAGSRPDLTGMELAASKSGRTLGRPTMPTQAKTPLKRGGKVMKKAFGGPVPAQQANIPMQANPPTLTQKPAQPTFPSQANVPTLPSQASATARGIMSSRMPTTGGPLPPASDTQIVSPGPMTQEQVQQPMLPGKTDSYGSFTQVPLYKKGGYVKKATGGLTGLQKAMQASGRDLPANQRVHTMKKGGKAYKADGGLVPLPVGNRVMPNTTAQARMPAAQSNMNLPMLPRQANTTAQGATGNLYFANATPKMKSGGKVPKAGAYKIPKVMTEFKSGELHSGSKSGPVVKSRKQAVAIALSEARSAGKKK